MSHIREKKVRLVVIEHERFCAQFSATIQQRYAQGYSTGPVLCNGTLYVSDRDIVDFGEELKAIETCK